MQRHYFMHTVKSGTATSIRSTAIRDLLWVVPDPATRRAAALSTRRRPTVAQAPAASTATGEITEDGQAGADVTPHSINTAHDEAALPSPSHGAENGPTAATNSAPLPCPLLSNEVSTTAAASLASSATLSAENTAASSVLAAPARRRARDPTVVDAEVSTTSTERPTIVLRRLQPDGAWFIVCSESSSGFFDLNQTVRRNPVRMVFVRWTVTGTDATSVLADIGAAVAAGGTLSLECSSCSCGEIESLCAVRQLLLKFLKNPLQRSNIRCDTLSVAYTHHHSFWSVCPGNEEPVAVVVLGRKVVPSLGRIKFECKGASAQCKSRDEFCVHRQAVFRNVSIVLTPDPEAAPTAASQRVAPKALTVAFKQDKQDGRYTSAGEFVPGERGLRMISAGFTPQSLSGRGITVEHKYQKIYDYWRFCNSNSSEIPSLNDGWACPTTGHVTERFLFFVQEDKNLLLVHINVCTTCSSACLVEGRRVDEKYDIFLANVPRQKDQPGFGITVSTARAFEHRLCTQRACLSNLQANCTAEANREGLVELLTAQVDSKRIRMEDKTWAKIKDDPRQFVSYDREQKTVFACLSTFKKYGAFLKGYEGGCGNHDVRKGHVHIVVDAVHTGMPDSFAPDG